MMSYDAVIGNFCSVPYHYQTTTMPMGTNVLLWIDSSDQSQLGGDGPDGFLVFDPTDGEMGGLAVQSFTQFMDDFKRFKGAGSLP